MENPPIRPVLFCWCGNSRLTPFSPGYFYCPACQSLVSEENLNQPRVRNLDDRNDFYGRNYWFGHQEQDLGFPNIRQRARSDLPERCLYWLKTLLKYRTPPGNVLELGCGHGGLAALLKWSGFQSTGLELSPWVVGFGQKSFGVPILLGPVEDQNFRPASWDVIIMMDVLEHLAHPLKTLAHCSSLLTTGGFFLVQTPCFPEKATYPELIKAGDPFLKLLQPKEHLYLFSRKALIALIERLNLSWFVFEPAYFGFYDQFAVIGFSPLPAQTAEAIQASLEASPGGRLIQALMDLSVHNDRLSKDYQRKESSSPNRTCFQTLKQIFSKIGIYKCGCIV